MSSPDPSMWQSPYDHGKYLPLLCVMSLHWSFLLLNLALVE